MNPIKVVRDAIMKFLVGKSLVPMGLAELHKYFRRYGPISFKRRAEDGVLIAVSENFRFGSIVASGKTPEELDRSVKDGILTAFSVPSSYRKEAAVEKVGEMGGAYAIA